MASTDWTAISNGSGAYAIIVDATAPSPPDVMNISAGGQSFQNITAGPFKDSRISAWHKQNGTTSEMYLSLRSLDNTTFISAPATFFLARVTARFGNKVAFTIEAVVNGVVTQLFTTPDIASQNGDTINTWQQYQFSALNSASDILLRFAQWNGAVFVPLADCAAPIATFPTLDAAGFCRFGGLTGGGLALSIDDVNYYSLA